MPDVFDANGLQTKSLTELITELETTLKSIYGTDINVDSNSPDGQQINIYSQGAVDIRELLTQLNASFDFLQAEGKVLDQRVGLIGIKRNEGSFTLQPVEITIDRALSLVGLDGDATEINPQIENLYTVKDDEGNEFYLLSSQSEAGAGTYTYTFRAANLGKVEVLPNTITTPVTVIAGVTNINNPNAPSSVGVDEETDTDLKTRALISSAIRSVGYLDSIETALKNLDNVTEAIVYENNTDVTDSNGIPPHSIWAIVEGGDPDEIAQTIYAKKSSGSGMKGVQSVTITRPNGQDFIVNYDTPTDEDLYIRLTVTPTLSASAITDLKQAIVDNVTWEIGGDATADVIPCFVKTYLGNSYVVSGSEVSLNGSTWFESVSPSGLDNRFKNDVSRITVS
jgi:uncharacterized phage protein gp47/JayE